MDTRADEWDEQMKTFRRYRDALVEIKILLTSYGEPYNRPEVAKAYLIAREALNA